MGLTGTTSWKANSTASTVQRYTDEWEATGVINYQGVSYFILANAATLNYRINCMFTIKTDNVGCSKLSFNCDGFKKGDTKLYWKVQPAKTLNTKNMTQATYSSDKWSGALNNVSLLPNTTYYVLFHATYGSDQDNVNDLHGTMKITGSGTYGAPGDIIAPDAVNFNDPIDMSFGSATDGGKYTVDVQVGESTPVRLQTYTDVPVEETIGITEQHWTYPTLPPTVYFDGSIFIESVASHITPRYGTYNIEYLGGTSSNASWRISKGTYNIRTVIGSESRDYGFQVMPYASGTSLVYPEIGDYFVITYTEPSSADGTNDNLTWTPLLVDYGYAYPNTPTVPCVITVKTYFGTVLSGTKTKTVTVSFTAAQVGPGIDNTVFTIVPKNEGVISEFEGYIQNYSAIRALFDDTSVTLKHGATIAKWSVKFGNSTAIDITDSSIVSQDSNIISSTTNVLFTLTDSRGFTVSTTLTATIIPYQQPTFTATVIRCDSSGNADDGGTYVKVALNALYADIDSQNTLTAQAHIKLKADETYGTPITITGGTTTASGTNDIYEVTSFLISGFLDRIYDIKLVITDGLQNIAKLDFTIQSQAWALHFRNGGTGVAFGKASERDNELDIGSWKITCGAISSHIIAEFDSLSSLPVTIYDEAITAGHIVIRDELTEPSAMIGRWSVDTYNGSLTVDGNISGVTDLRLVLEIPGTSLSA